MNNVDVAELSRLEAIIEEGKETFLKVAMALSTIHEKKLYLCTHTSFEAYCQQRWGFTRQRAYQLMGTAEIVTRVPDVSTVVDIPERALRELHKLPTPEAQRAALVVAMATAPEGKVTTTWMASTVEVMQEAVNTHGKVSLDGEAIALNAAITEEAHERMMRQKEHIKAKYPQSRIVATFDSTSAAIAWLSAHAGERLSVVVKEVSGE